MTPSQVGRTSNSHLIVALLMMGFASRCSVRANMGKASQRELESLQTTLLSRLKAVNSKIVSLQTLMLESFGKHL